MCLDTIVDRYEGRERIQEVEYWKVFECRVRSGQACLVTPFQGSICGENEWLVAQSISIQSTYYPRMRYLSGFHAYANRSHAEATARDEALDYKVDLVVRKVRLRKLICAGTERLYVDDKPVDADVFVAMEMMVLPEEGK